MLAVLENAIECFQKRVFARSEREKKIIPRSRGVDFGER
jgi:hypothetical protein